MKLRKISEGISELFITIVITLFLLFFLNRCQEWAIAFAVSTGVRVGIRILTAGTAFVMSILSLYMELRLRQKKAGIFSLLCFAVGAYSLLKFLYTIGMLPVHPWNEVSLLCAFQALFLIVALYNSLCCVGYMVRKASIVVTGALCVSAVVLGYYSEYRWQDMLAVYDRGTELIKLCAVGYLALISGYAVKKYNSVSKSLYYTVLGMFILALHRFLMYGQEIIFAESFNEVSNFVITVTIGCSIWKEMIVSYKHQYLFQEEHRQIIRQLPMQMEYTRQLSLQDEENRRLNHDFRHHLRVLDMIAQAEGKKAIQEYIGQISRDFDSEKSGSDKPVCKNVALDALLRYYQGQAMRIGVKIDIGLNLPEFFPLTDVEMCTVVGNLMENAVEACEKQNHGERVIHLRANTRTHILAFSIENTYEGKVVQSGKRFLSGKRGFLEYGIGVESAVHIVETYGGEARFEITDKIFKVVFTVPIKIGGKQLN